MNGYNDFNPYDGMIGDSWDMESPVVDVYGNPLGENSYGVNGYNGMNHIKRPGKREIINWFQREVGASEMDYVDEASEPLARHVCAKVRRIELLPKRVFNFQFEDGGIIPIEYYQCNICGKLILDKNFM